MATLSQNPPLQVETTEIEMRPTLTWNSASSLDSWRPAALALLVGVTVWEVAGRVLDLSFLPPLSQVLAATARMLASGEIISNLGASLFALVIGYTAAVCIGVPLGLLMARSATFAEVCDPFINILLATPSLLFVPLLFGIFGISRVTEIAVVFLYSFTILTVVSANALRGVDSNQIEMARAFGARESQLFRRVLLPGAMPMLMAGLRLGMGRAFVGMINGEMLIVLVGLGALLRSYGGRFDAASVYGILIVIVAVALCAQALLTMVDRRVNRWSN